MSHATYILRILRPHKKRIIVIIAALLGIMVIDLGSPLVVAILIDEVVARNRYDLLAPLMLVFLLLPFGAAVFRFFSNTLIAVLGQRVIFDIRLALYRRVHQLHCRVMHRTTTGKLMERLRGDVQQLQTLLTNQAPQLMVQVVTGLIMIAVMFWLSTTLTLVMLVGISIYVLNYRRMVPRIRKVQRRYRRKVERLSGLAQERLSGAIIVKSFGCERVESREFIKRNFAAERVFDRYRRLNSNYSLFSSLVTWGTYSAILVVGVLLAIRGAVTYGVITAVTAFAFRLLVPASMLAELSNQMQQARVSLDRIFELMDAEADVIEQPGIRQERLRGEVSFENIFFQYEPDKPVLRHLNLKVKPGQTVALVGQTGCGKSTIINLLYRYYDVTSGCLTIDGHDIKDFETRWYRRQLAMVPQEPIILDTTIAENIKYGCPDATRQQVLEAARLAELGGIIDQLDNGLDTSLGDYGITLSVGEKQRLCIARAILADPAILILDEATSSLDSRSETLIQMAMMRVMARRTSFIVAHRLSTIVNADLIVVLDNGAVVEMGNHAQLIARPDGRYRHLYLAQTSAMPKARVV